MRSLILSDIHSNIEALDAVLDVVPRDTYDQLLVLGDLVGYGASPNEVVDRIYDLEPDVLIRGNHDKVASGVESPHQFNQVAAEAATWTLDRLTDANRERLASLPAGPAAVDEIIEVCHGTPFDEDVYVFDEDDARKALAAASRRVCFSATPICRSRSQQGTTDSTWSSRRRAQPSRRWSHSTSGAAI